jgi:outer membrane protein
LKIATASLSKFAAGLALGWLAMAPVHAQSSRIAWLSSERIYNESKMAKLAGDKLAEEFSRREKSLQDMANRLKGANARLEKDGLTMQESERNRLQKEAFELDRDFQRRQREFREDLNQRTNEERAAIADKATRIIKALAQTEGFDIVLQDAVWASPRIDITNKVLEALDKDK